MLHSLMLLTLFNKRQHIKHYYFTYNKSIKYVEETVAKINRIKNSMTCIIRATFMIN